MKDLYFDHFSASRPSSAAIERFRPYLDTLFASPAAPHLLGQEVKRSQETPLQSLYDACGASPSDACLITRSGAEAINQVLWTAFFERARKEGRGHVVLFALDDAPFLQMGKRLEELGCFVKLAPPTPSGSVDLDALASLIGPRTALVSLSAASTLSGVIQPLSQIGDLARSKGAWLHLDISATLGALDIPFRETQADFFTLSGAKIHSVPSSGALFAKALVPVSPLILGQSSIDSGALAALGAAARTASLYLDPMNLETARLRTLLEEKLSSIGARPLFTEELRTPHTSLIAFPGVHAEMLLYRLQQKRLFASLGGADAPPVSHYLTACGFPLPLAQSALSFSLSRYTTEEEILLAVERISVVYQTLKPLTEDIF
jgi:cysteine desulfurase